MPDFVMAVQKEMFRDHFFFDRMEKVELEPLKPEQMVEAYRKRFKSLEPFTEDALLTLALQHWETISAATGILRNYRKAKRKNPYVKEPYARRPRLTTCYGFKIRDGELSLPIHAKEHVRISLNQHVQATINGMQGQNYDRRRTLS